MLKCYFLLKNENVRVIKMVSLMFGVVIDGVIMAVVVDNAYGFREIVPKMSEFVSKLVPLYPLVPIPTMFGLFLLTVVSEESLKHLPDYELGYIKFC